MTLKGISRQLVVAAGTASLAFSQEAPNLSTRGGCGRTGAADLRTTAGARETAGDGGLEWAAAPRIGLFGYFSGFHAAHNTALDVNGSLIGFGFEGSTNARRSAQEWTAGWSQALWSSDDAGSIQYAVQYSRLGNAFWSSGNAPG
jgi:hypothetical protein